ncbi:TonB-dependent receptor [Myroides odoratimimus]|uniref:outer membrane beta-barrel family protein n=1 Tax=Myroides odoratimimus TaxID=76832 RepID=UPI002574AFEE|nr:outer membrane beta-barrel family protein [Myroides odoratimimus]MDM1447418.1 TonB-dependent receptor [Myroides odoratimimus]
MKRPYIWLLSLCSLGTYAQTEAQLDSILNAFNTNLGEVLITTKAPVFQQKADKMVFSVENSALSDGSTVLEVLGRAPGVVVSQEGELSLRGKKGVSVMLNGKLSSLSAKELANLLRSTNSSQVKNIEIIANPSAKYDAAGNAGIINIVLKKYNMEGLKGSSFVNAGRGRKNRLNAGFNLGYTHEKLSLFGDYSYTFRGEEEHKHYLQDFYNTTNPSVIDRHSEQRFTSNEPLTSNNFKFGVDYALSSKTTVGFLFDAKIGRYEDYSKGYNMIYAPVETLNSHVNTDNRNKEHWYDYTFNLTASHLFNDKGSKVDVDLEYETSKFRSEQSQLADVLLNNSNAPYRNRRGYIPSHFKVFNGKLDFTLPLDDKHALETGWKSIVKSNDNPSVYEFQNNSGWEVDPASTNHYKYNEQIHAAYANYKLSLEHWSFQVGLRSEFTQTEIDQKTTKEYSKNDYTKLFPSASIKYETDNAHGFYASYSKRINRPSHFDLNPFRFYDDPFNYWQGNPKLKPEITHASEVGYTWSKYLIANVYFSVTNDVMTNVYNYQADTGILVSTQENLNKSYHYGANVTGTVSPTEWWSMSNMFNLFNNKYEGNYQGTEINSSQVAFTFNSQNNFTIVKGLKADVNAQYFSKSNLGLYKRDSYFDLTIGLSKALLEDKATIKLAVTDVLNTVNYNVTGDNFNSNIRKKYDLDSRIATLSFNYKF